MAQPSKTKLAQAIKALGIDVPVYRAETAGQGVRLYLYGHAEPVTWSPPRRKTTKKSDGD